MESLYLGIAVLTSTLCIICGVIIRNLLNQVEQLEAELDNIDEVEERALRVYNFFLELFSNTLAELHRVDRNGAFASDDEVGFVFRTLMESIEHVKHQIELLKSNTQNLVNDENKLDGS
jgi:hypothetical protein